jgi:phosphate transport system substrate-binding protein
MKLHTLFTAAFLAVGIQASAQTVTVMGSTALGPLVKVAADKYMASHPGVQITVTGGGSMTGLNQVVQGGCTIGISDVFATPDQDKVGIQNHNIVVQPFTLIVNPGVGVQNLSAQQAEAIFTGRINNWKEVGGKDQKIVRIVRPESSGTRAVQKKEVLHGQDFSKDVIVQDSTGAVVNAVATTVGSISFVELEHLERNKNKIAGVKYDGAECTTDNVKAGKYKVFSFGHAYTNPTKGDAKAQQIADDFLTFLLSPAVQHDVVVKAGYLPVDVAKNLKTQL